MYNAQNHLQLKAGDITYKEIKTVIMLHSTKYLSEKEEGVNCKINMVEFSVKCYLIVAGKRQRIHTLAILQSLITHNKQQLLFLFLLPMTVTQALTQCQTNVVSSARNCNVCWERDQQFFCGHFVLARDTRVEASNKNQRKIF